MTMRAAARKEKRQNAGHTDRAEYIDFVSGLDFSHGLHRSAGDS